ncbi:hypothetical protein XELAEV_18006166mg, partial [Xenopus laevis]
NKKVVWLLGHSYIRRAGERAAVRKGGMQLGFPEDQVSIRWFGVGGLLWPGVMDKACSLSAAEGNPNVLVLHAGGNDMGVISQRDLVRAMKQDVDKLRSFFQGVVIVWSEMVGRLVWRWARDRDAMERSRQKLNKLLSAFIRHSGGIVGRHKVLESCMPGHYCRDGVHLSAVGTDIFKLGLTVGLEGPFAWGWGARQDEDSSRTPMAEDW